ncbi:hypothetical protein SBDP1_70006 [Syntrophobacter sp. SbD1]|nr:hypothetical protein SBDP1_70006 [Syntrophobacter sp. SbD1]
MFSNLSKGHLKEIAKITEEVSIPADNYIVKEGSYGIRIYFYPGWIKTDKTLTAFPRMILWGRCP